MLNWALEASTLPTPCVTLSIHLRTSAGVEVDGQSRHNSDQLCLESVLGQAEAGADGSFSAAAS
jgi:hypothetical protein